MYEIFSLLSDKLLNLTFIVVAETVVGATTGVVSAPKGYFKGIFTTYFPSEVAYGAISHEICLRKVWSLVHS